MDLGQCPRCGSVWCGGEVCLSCGYVAIGAGLDRLPKKKKRKARRYVEPGSWSPFLFTMFILTSGFWSFTARPWQDDWALVRMLVGQGRPRSVLGDWEITKTVSFYPGRSVLLANQTNRGGMRFDPKGTMGIWLGTRGQQVEVNGKYDISGRHLVVRNLQPKSGLPFRFPGQVPMKLTWISADSFVANVQDQEMIYVRRHAIENSYARMLRYGLNPTAARKESTFRGQLTHLESQFTD